MMFILPSSTRTITPTVFLAWFALCTTAKPVWFPAVLPKSNANFEVELPFPFEIVLRTWENGPPDPQFLRFFTMICFVPHPAFSTLHDLSGRR
jgi:hypothetical protein